MKDLSVSYSLLREFADFLVNLANYKRFSKKPRWAEPDVFSREMTSEAHERLTPTLRADLKLFVKDTALYTYPFYAPSVMETVADYGGYAALTADMDGGEYIKFFLDSNGDEVPGKTDDERMENLADILKRVDQGEQILESYWELKRHPDEQLRRARSFMDRMYKEFFRPYENRIEEFLRKKPPAMVC